MASPRAKWKSSAARIAEDRQNEEFYISNAWLTQLENKNSIPSIYKLYSLSVIYRTKFNDLLTVFGIDLGATSRYQLALPLQNTHLTSFESLDPEKAITFPVRFDKSFSLDTTSLISRMVEVWGEVPIALIQKLDVRHCQYGYIGIQDYHDVSAAASWVIRSNRQPSGQHAGVGMAHGIRPARFISSNCGTAMPVRGAKCAGLN